VIVGVTKNTIGSVTIALLSADGTTPLASTTSSAANFTLPPVTLPAAGTYAVVIDPSGPDVGALEVTIGAPSRD
jgi:hypothetical protein